LFWEAGITYHDIRSSLNLLKQRERYYIEHGKSTLKYSDLYLRLARRFEFLGEHLKSSRWILVLCCT
jgi:hypothetical protein